MLRRRPFKLIDAMILTAAAAVWMARMRTLWNELQMIGMASRKGIPWHFYAGTAQTGLNITLLMLTVAYLVICLIPPRPPRWDLMRQPGMLLLGLLVGFMILLMALSAFVPLVAPTNMLIVFALYLNFVVLIVQSFQKVAVLNALSPMQSEPPFMVIQIVSLVAFLTLGTLAAMRFRPESLGVA